MLELKSVRFAGERWFTFFPTKILATASPQPKVTLNTSTSLHAHNPAAQPEDRG
jgi:hypothetical protein